MKKRSYIARAYQGPVSNQIINLARSNVWATPGLGKTIATLTALEHLYVLGYETWPTLVLAPKRVAQSTWPDEVALWDHLHNIEVQTIVGTEAQRLAALRNRNASVYTTNYENLPWLFEVLGGKWPFGIVVADESSRLKNYRGSEQVSKTGTEFVRAAGGIRARELAKVAHTRVRRWVNLTGSPAPNGLQDIWGSQWFVDAGKRLERTFEGFTRRWFVPAPSGYGSVPMQMAQADIEARLADCTISVRAKDYFDLRDPIESTRWVTLPDKQMDRYRELEKEMFTLLVDEFGVEHDIEALNSASKTIKCLQFANGAAYVEPDDGSDTKEWREVHDEKLQALDSLLAELGGRPVLVAYHLKSDLARLRKAFPRGRVFDDDPQTLRDWNACKIALMFIHPASAGHGLSMQHGGHVLIFFSIWWNLEEHEQVKERLGPTRQIQSGYDRPVHYYYILARETVDETIMDRLLRKDRMQDALRRAMVRKGIA